MGIRYCKELGFDEKGIQVRLDLLELTDADIETGELLQSQVIRPNIKGIIDGFYHYLTTNPDMLLYLDNEELINRLKKTQTAYLETLGCGFSSEYYFEERLRVGLAHAKVRIPPYLYICSYQKMRELICSFIPESIQPDENLRYKLFTFVNKITALDMSLAIEIYHNIQVDKLESSIRTLRREEDSLRHKAETDLLTGLANHAHVVSVLETALNAAKTNNDSLCVMMADLDFFKNVNDTHGHLVGDSVLREVAARINSIVRDIDLVGRYGGEEFIVIFNNTKIELASEVAERLRRHIANSPINLQGNEISITISIGLCAVKPGDDVNSIIGRADKALYLAKNSGRNCVKVCNT